MCLGAARLYHPAIDIKIDEPDHGSGSSLALRNIHRMLPHHVLRSRRIGLHSSGCRRGLECPEAMADAERLWLPSLLYA